MKLLTAVLTAATFFAGSVMAKDLEVIEGAYEATLGDVTLPGSIAGSAIFRACDDCDTVGLRVSGSTVFQISGRSLQLADFTLAVDGIRDSAGGNGSTLVVIFYDLNSNSVTRINVVPQGS